MLSDEDRDRVLAAVSGILHADVRLVAELKGSSRTAVLRVSDGTETYVVKCYPPSPDTATADTWAREASALEVAGSAGAGPRLLGSCADPKLVVMADLGPERSLADALLGSDRVDARGRLLDWTRAVARLHRPGGELAAAFATALSTRAPHASEHDIPFSFGPSADQLARVLPDLGLSHLDGAVERFRTVWQRFRTAATVLSPGDCCPDNNLVGARGLTLIDFEFAEARHPAWDVAYLRVPWPTCWCAWRLPGGLADEAVALYRAELRATAPYVDTADFARDIDLATLGWALWSAGFVLSHIAGRPADNGPHFRRPQSRPLLLHRLGQAAALDVDPELQRLARELHLALTRRWQAAPLLLAPAFR